MAIADLLLDANSWGCLAPFPKVAVSTGNWHEEYSQARQPSAVSGVSVEFLVAVEKGKTSYGAYVPDPPGCVAVGESRRKVLRLIHEGIQVHIQAMREAGEPVPTPTSKSEIVKIKAA
jgi:predicted RNase H-like HicB family nuclease